MSVLLPKNDAARIFFKENRYPEQYNDGIVTYLRDLLQVTNYTLPDLLHMYQELYGNVLVLTPVPRRNLLNWTEEFNSGTSGSHWTRTNVRVFGNWANSPINVVTADAVSEESNTGVHEIVRNVYTTSSAPITHTLSLYVKKVIGSRKLQIILRGTAYNLVNMGCFDIDTKMLSLSSGIAGGYTDAGGDWYRVYITATTNNPGTVITAFALSDIVTTTPRSYTGDNGVSDLRIWGGQLEIGQLTNYQYQGAP